MNNIPVRALLDTGATFTHIREDIRLRLEQQGVRSQKHCRTVQLADGTCIEGIQVYPITILYNGKRSRLLASSLPNLAEPLIIGMDFLRQRQVKLVLEGVQIEPPSSLNALSDIDHMTSEEEKRFNKKLNTEKGKFNALKRPFEPGHIKKGPRQTNMPKKVKLFTSPFDVSRKDKTIHTKNNTTSLVTKSGANATDKIAKDFQNQPPHTETQPLTSFSNAQSNETTPEDHRKETLPPLLPILTKQTTEQSQQAETDLLNDVLELTAQGGSREKFSEEIDEDLFKDIVINDPGVPHKIWYIYPPGRIKIRVTVKKRKITLKCLGRVKEINR